MLQAQALALLIPSAPGQDMHGANAYLARRPLHAGSASTLRKLSRAQRIAARRRPLSMPLRQETVIMEAEGFELVEIRTLHPTKGWRSERRSRRRA